MEDLNKHFTEAEKKYLREAFIGNETDTDEYRERWPEKGFDFLSEIFESTRFPYGPILNTITDAGPENLALLDATITWLEAFRGEGACRYAGSDDASKVCGLVFDILWSQNKHPYHGNNIDHIREYLDEFFETETVETETEADSRSKS